MRARNYYAYPNIRDHWELRCMNRCPDLEDRGVVYRASTPQVWGSINGLRKVDSAFHPGYIGSKNEYQACFGS
ncbi:hypothetical protein TNCV_3317911 [Trichonephila clavipes]|nr:hypothetical protein TNCV_3317911 [Trichonephila clavipes]